MKQHSTLRPIASRTLSAVATLAAPAMLWAQVSLYNYSESVETYTEVTAEEASYSLGVATWWPPLHNLRAWANNEFFAPDGQVTNGGYLGPAIGPGYPIGFNFTYNGDVFDRIGVANGGWISFGKSSDGNRSVVIFTSDHPAGRPLSQSYWPTPSPLDHAYQRDRIAGWGAANLYMRDHSQQDPPGTISSLRIATIGAAPNRVCVIQWKDYLDAYPPSDSRLNFQIRLYETTNVVEVRFGPTVWKDMSASVQIGLGGRTSEDFNNRKTVYEQPAFLYDWNITAAGTQNTDACLASSEQPGHPNGSGIPPVVGRTFKWTPPACPPPAWPVTVGEITFRSGVAQWEPTPAGEYEYFVSAQNSITGTEAASGTTTDPEAVIEGLSPMTTYYVFVRGICDGEPGTWSLGTPFRTLGGGLVVCDGTTLQEDYCSHQNDVVGWLYASPDGSPLKIEFQGGLAGLPLKIWNGGGPNGNADLELSGDVTGQSFLASSGKIYIQLTTDNGSCETQDWYYRFKWRVGCKNCTDPLVQYSVGEVDCAAQQYYVNASVFMLGSSSTLVLENSLGLPPMTVNTTGMHAVGPFPAGDPVIITAQNPDNAMCYTPSAEQVNEPCAVVDCGPTRYTRCLRPSEVHDWLLQGDGRPISVRFLPAYFGWNASVVVYDGGDDTAPPHSLSTGGFWGGTNNEVFTSTNPEHQLLVHVVASTYSDYACSAGNGAPLDFVVGCVEACDQPKVTFSYADCTVPTSFSVLVNVTDLGSGGSVTLSNDGGAPAVVASTTGTYTVGPFTSGDTVTVNVEGANTICTWTSSKLTKDCRDMGIGDASMRPVSLYPNPNDGRFTLELPQEMTGSTQLQVLDLTGRSVIQQRVSGTGRVSVELSELPNGLYTVVLRNNERTATGRISIQH
ncbi:MAG: T9SS type A sorting domain-containing protein [Flavobacteriales bacterium]